MMIQEVSEILYAYVPVVTASTTTGTDDDNDKHAVVHPFQMDMQKERGHSSFDKGYTLQPQTPLPSCHWQHPVPICTSTRYSS